MTVDDGGHAGSVNAQPAHRGPEAREDPGGAGLTSEHIADDDAGSHGDDVGGRDGGGSGNGDSGVSGAGCNGTALPTPAMPVRPLLTQKSWQGPPLDSLRESCLFVRTCESPTIRHQAQQ